MNPLDDAKAIRDIIGKARSYRGTPDLNELFLDAETIIGSLAYLIGPKIELEAAYRAKVVEYMEAGDSHAKAEAKARASDAYKNWKKVESIYELGHEQVMLLKKFKDDLNSEYKRT